VQNVVNPDSCAPHKNEMAADFYCAIRNRTDGTTRHPRSVCHSWYIEDRIIG